MRRSKQSLDELIERHDGRCFYCDSAVDPTAPPGSLRKSKPSRLAPTRDHLIPRSRGGKGKPNNKVLACYRCNNLKGDMSVAEFRLFLRLLPLFDNSTRRARAAFRR